MSINIFSGFLAEMRSGQKEHHIVINYLLSNDIDEGRSLAPNAYYIRNEVCVILLQLSTHLGQVIIFKTTFCTSLSITESYNLDKILYD